MGWIAGIRRRLAVKALNRRVVPRSGKARMMCLEDAASIGVIYAYPADGKERVTRLASLPPLKGRKVRMLGYMPYKPAKEELVDDQTFTAREIDRKFRPLAGAVEAFLEHKFDILLDLSLEDQLPLLWILAEADASMKVSLHSDLKEPLADLLIRMSPSDDPGILFGQMTHYLEQFNHKS